MNATKLLSSFFICLLLISPLLTGCDAASDQDHEVTHAEHGHGHGDAAIAITHFTDQSEMFVEFSTLVVGQDSAFAAHLTRLDNFKPVAEGHMTILLSGGDLPEERFEVSAPQIPGIFRPVAKPKHAGKRQLTIELKSPSLHVTHALGDTIVYADAEAAAHAQPEEENDEGAISYLKEQQWKVDFATAEVKTELLRASVAATGELRARADGEVHVPAPIAGHLMTVGKAFPRIGMPVKKGQILAEIAPRLGGHVDISSLKLHAQKARSSYQLAMQERKRLEDLLKQEAVPKRRVNIARSGEKVARAEMQAAERRLGQYQRNPGKSHAQAESGLAVRAPIDGTLAQVHVAAGTYLSEGQPMFHIVNLERLWLEARIPEASIGHLRQPTGAWFRISGFDQVFNIQEGNDASMLAYGGVVDSVSRTVPLIFEFANPDKILRIGMFAQVRVLTGEVANDIAIPNSAVINDGGQDVVYVELGGESFARRVVNLGIRDGDRVQVKSGLKPGERVVTRGAYLIRLASASPAEAGHGHAH